MSLERRQRIASTVQKHPLIVRGLIHGLRLTRPRFTAGVVGVLPDPQGRILLVNHVYHPEYPWGLPGGWMGFGESPESALIREMREELQLVVRIIQPLRVENAIFRTHLDISFLVSATGSPGKVSEELIGYNWFALNSLPPLNPSHRAAIEAYQTCFCNRTE